MINFATNDEVAKTRAFVKRFFDTKTPGNRVVTFNNKRKTFRMVKFWYVPAHFARDIEWFLNANTIPYTRYNSRMYDAKRVNIKLHTPL